MCPTPTTGRVTVSSGCSSSCTPPARGCSSRSAPDACRERAGAVTLPAGARDVTRVGGGDINEAFHVVLADGSDAFVKTRRDAAPGEYAAEAAGLAFDERYLVLEWIPPAPRGRLEDAGAEELGRGLAATHAAGAPCFGDAAA